MKLILALSFFLISIAANTQEIELDPVTISATLQQTTASRTGRNIIVIKGDQFNNLPVHSIDELLRYVPGIEVQARGPQGSQSDILIRGGTFQQVLVLLDGIRLNDPLTGHFNAYIPIAPSEIERIEIVKGASSALYGSDAVGGVIHIISKTFAANSQLTAGELGGQIAVGEYGLLNGNIGGHLRRKGKAMSLGFITNNAKGQPQRGIKGYFHNTTVSASFKRQWHEWSFALRSAYDTRDFAAQNFYTAFTSDTATEKVKQWWNHAQLNWHKQRHKLSVDAGYKQTDDQYAFNKNAAPNENLSKTFQSLVLYTYRVDESASLNAGTQFINRSIVSNDRGNHAVPNMGIFVLLNKNFGKLSVSPALRYEQGWIPQLNFSYRVKNLLLRGSIGKSIRDADFTEAYNNYNKSLVTSGNIGNPDLEPERAWALEAGAEYILSDHFKISGTLFTKYYKDLIDWVHTPFAEMPRKENLSPTGSYFLASNISDLNTSGFETDILFSKQLNKHHAIHSSVGLTVINSSATPSLYISSHANLLVNGSVQWRYHWLQLAVNGLYKKRAGQTGNAALAPLSKDYFVLNARVNAKWFFLQCDNIFDRDYADRFGVPMPGRWWSGGLTVQLRKKNKVDRR